VSSVSAHDYYLSISQIEYNTDTKRFEIAIKVTAHDCEYAIEKSNGDLLKLGSDHENPKSDEIIEAYFLKHFKLIADNVEVNLHMIGKELGLDEELWVYIESNEVEPPSNVRVTNSLLAFYFNKQQNHVHLKLQDKTYAVVMMNGEYTHTIVGDNK